MKTIQMDQIPLAEAAARDHARGSHAATRSPSWADHVELRANQLTERQRALPMEPDSTYVDLQCLADIEIEPLERVWGSVAMKGAVTVLAGEPGIGKSFVALDIAAAATTSPLQAVGARRDMATTGGVHARRVMGSDPPQAECARRNMGLANESLSRVDVPRDSLAEPMGVLICSPHYERATTLIPRLIAAKADLSRVQTISGVREAEDIDRDGSCWSFQLDRDLAILESELVMLQGNGTDIGLIVIDPFPSGDFSGNRQARKLNDVMSRLAEIAVACHVAVLVVCDALPLDHPKRATSVTLYPAIEKVAQSVWVVEQDPDSPKRRLLLPAKSNLDEDPSALAFSIHDKTVAWESESVSLTAQEFRRVAMQRRRNPLLFEDTSELARATDWLKARLANGPIESWRIKEESHENEISYATLRRAFCGLRCESNHVKGTRHHTWGATGTFPARRMTGAECGDLSRDVATGGLSAGGVMGIEAGDLSHVDRFVETGVGVSSIDFAVTAKTPQSDPMVPMQPRVSAAASCVCDTPVAETATGATQNDLADQVRAHDERVLEHQFEHVFDSVKQGVSSDFLIGAH